jgi:dTDP-4-amino-4,6-dideoxygalactose transaminase
VRVADRDAVAERLGAAGVGTALHYFPAAHEHQPMREARRGEVGEAERWAREELSLPMFPGLSEPEVARVCEALAEAAR